MKERTAGSIISGSSTLSQSFLSEEENAEVVDGDLALRLHAQSVLLDEEKKQDEADKNDTRPAFFLRQEAHSGRADWQDSVVEN